VIDWPPPKLNWNAVVVEVATPALSAPVPRVVVSSEKVTVPVGVPLPGEAAVTVVVKATTWPYTDGFVDSESVPSGNLVVMRVAVLPPKLPVPREVVP
jgi:hypothetical protein